MRLKFIKLNYEIKIALTLFLFFFLLKLNQTSFEYTLIGNTYNLKFYVYDYLNFFFSKLSYIDFLVLILLLIPGIIISNLDTNFTNISIYLLYLFFFTPIFIFFLKIDINFFKTLTNKTISLNQLDLYLLFFFLYLNLLLLIFFSKLKINFIIKPLIINEKTIKFLCFLFILFLIFFSLLKIYLAVEKFDFDLSNFSVNKNSSFRGLLNGLYGRIYYISLFVVMPLYYLIDKKKYELIFISFIYLLLFILFQTKINLVLMIMIIFWSKSELFNFEKLKHNFLKLILIGLALTLIISLFLHQKYQIHSSLYFERIFLSQSKNLFLVYDFINLNDLIYLTHMSFLDYFYPYELNFYDLIKKIYGGGSATSNSYIIDGLASFGMMGFFFVTLVFSLIFKIIDNQINFNKSKFNLIYLIQIIGFLSFPLGTQFLTYGLGLTILLSMIKIQK